MDKICIFDVNETLLDMAALDPLFARLFGDPGERHLWFRTVLQTSLVLTLTDSYRPFATIMADTLSSRAAARGRSLAGSDMDALAQALRALPLHPDVLPGLKTLRAAGYRVAALTNSAAESAQMQLEKAGAGGLFEAVFSTDAVQAAKPSSRPYLHAAHQMGVPHSALWLVAAHAWDTHGAKRAGLKAALVRRPMHGLNPCFESPDAAGDDLPGTIEALIAFDRPTVPRMSPPRGG